MATIKDWFKGRGAGQKESLSADDLIALGRLDEAESRLRSDLEIRRADLHQRLKLADLLLRRGRRADALQEYFNVVDGHAREGFYNKAEALLAKLERLVPGNEKVRLKSESLRRLKKLDRRLDMLIDDPDVTLKTYELQRLWPDVAGSPMIADLTEPQLKRLFAAFRLLKLAENKMLVAAGSNTAKIYLVAQGEIAAQVRLASGKRTVIRSFGPGDAIGDRALLEHKPWPADYLATKPSKLLWLERAGLESALVGESDPKQFLDALRRQRHDHKVAMALDKLHEAV